MELGVDKEAKTDDVRNLMMMMMMTLNIYDDDGDGDVDDNDDGIKYV